jgi:hypothetical protein
VVLEAVCEELQEPLPACKHMQAGQAVGA